MKRAFSTLALLSFLFGFPTTVLADESVIVLGIRSMEGDDEFALSLTGALRHSASQVPGWSVSDREVSLAQMALAHSCDDPDVACMQQIAGTLAMQRVIYGTVRRTSTSAQFDYGITLYMFNAETGQIEGSLTDNIPRSQSDIDQFRGRVDGYVARLRGADQGGRLRIVGNVPGADIYVDGERAGTADAQGAFDIDVASGRRRVEVRAEGYTTFRGSVTVAPGTESEIEATLVEGSGVTGGGEVSGGGVSWLGIGLVGVGVLAAGAAVYTFLQLDSLREYNGLTEAQCADVEPGTFGAYRCRVPENLDACDQALDGAMWASEPDAAYLEARNTCEDRQLLDVLKFVFPAVAAVALGAGIYVLATGGDDEEEAQPALTLTPRLGPRGGDLSATLRF